MNTRPTPETDYQAELYGSGDAVIADFARKLERERDEAREELENILNVIPADAPCLHAETGETVADYILGMQKEVGRVHALYFNDKQQLEAMRKTMIATEAYQTGLAADNEDMRDAIKGAHEALADVENRSRDFEESHCLYALTSYLQSVANAALAKLKPFTTP